MTIEELKSKIQEKSLPHYFSHETIEEEGDYIEIGVLLKLINKYEKALKKIPFIPCIQIDR